MSDELRKVLTGDVADSDWSLLKPHYERSALIIIDKSLDLVDVGIALSKDDAESVVKWQESELIRKPTEEEVAAWDKKENERMAKFLIIQPFVLMTIL